jgi:regulator of sigma E protease
MLGSVPLPVFALVGFLVLITPLVVWHELGHFLVGRLFGCKVDRFSIGFGRPIVSWKTRSGMEWWIAWLPLGGYVKFSGDANVASAVPDSSDLAELKREIDATEGPGAYKRYFHFKPVWQRALIVFAGPFMNFVLAVAIYAVIFGAFTRVILPARIFAVMPGTPAAAAGFKPGDLIQKIEGVPIESDRDSQMEISLRSNTPTTFEVLRAGRTVTLTATPRRQRLAGSSFGALDGGFLGIEFRATPADVREVRDPPIEAVAHGVRENWRVLRFTLTYVSRIFTGKESGAAIGGPIGTAAMSGQVVRDAVLETQHQPLAVQLKLVGLRLLQMAALVSVSVGFLNLLPIPVLDGGHLLFYAYEAVARKPLGARVQEAGFRIGLALLAGLMLFATWNDLQKLSVFKNLGGLLS